MESNRKRRSSSGGFMKGKLTSFYRTAKPASTTTTTMQYSTISGSKAKPSQKPSAGNYSVGFMVHSDYSIAAQPQQKVSFIVPAVADHTKSTMKQFDLYAGGGGAGGGGGDDSVDMKAATYISSVQERFKLEIINS